MSCLNNRIGQGIVIEDGAACFLARILGNDATPVIQAAVQSISVKVFDVDATDPDTAVYSANLTVSTAIYDTLQTDDRWTEDDTGYNFRHDMPASAFQTGDHNYRVEYKFTPTLGEVFWALFDVHANNVRTS